LEKTSEKRACGRPLIGAEPNGHVTTFGFKARPPPAGLSERDQEIQIAFGSSSKISQTAGQRERYLIVCFDRIKPMEPFTHRYCPTEFGTERKRFFAREPAV
jgi:hypothetical protein